MLQKQIENWENGVTKNTKIESLKKNTKNQDKNEKLEQYGCRLCLRIDGVPVQKGETSEGVLKKVTSICEKANLDIPLPTCCHRLRTSYWE